MMPHFLTKEEIVSLRDVKCISSSNDWIFAFVLRFKKPGQGQPDHNFRNKSSTNEGTKTLLVVSLESTVLTPLLYFIRISKRLSLSRFSKWRMLLYYSHTFTFKLSEHSPSFDKYSPTAPHPLVYSLSPLKQIDQLARWTYPLARVSRTHSRCTGSISRFAPLRELTLKSSEQSQEFSWEVVGLRNICQVRPLVRRRTV